MRERVSAPMVTFASSHTSEEGPSSLRRHSKTEFGVIARYNPGFEIPPSFPSCKQGAFQAWSSRFLHPQCPEGLLKLCLRHLDCQSSGYLPVSSLLVNSLSSLPNILHVLQLVIGNLHLISV